MRSAYNNVFVMGVTHHVWCNPLICSETRALHGVHVRISTGFSTEPVDPVARDKGNLT